MGSASLAAARPTAQPPACPPGLWRQYPSSQEGWGVKTWSSSPDRRARVRTRSRHGPDCWGPEVCLISKIWRLEYNGMAQNISCHAKLQISSMEMRSLWQKKAGHRVTRTILVPQFSKWRLKSSQDLGGHLQSHCLAVLRIWGQCRW